MMEDKDSANMPQGEEGDLCERLSGIFIPDKV